MRLTSDKMKISAFHFTGVSLIFQLLIKFARLLPASIENDNRHLYNALF